MRKRSGFTLVELLVVVGIIGLLAAIMMPNLMTAQESAKRAGCLSNMHNAGTSIMIYTSANNDMYPTSYSYINGSSGGGGYYHWTAAINMNPYTAEPTAGKYPHTSDEFVCPSHAPHGWAPTNFTTYSAATALGRIVSPPAGPTSLTPGLDDRQAARLSYTANEILMPRKKFSAAYDATGTPTTINLCYVSTGEVDNIQRTILLAEFSNNSNNIYGASSAGGDAWKSHRPTNGIATTGGAAFNGEGYALGTAVFKLNITEALAAISAVNASKGASDTANHIYMVEPNMHKTGSNYTFADGHAAKFGLADTLDPAGYMWGDKVYSCADKPVIQDHP